MSEGEEKLAPEETFGRVSRQVELMGACVRLWQHPIAHYMIEAQLDRVAAKSTQR